MPLREARVHKSIMSIADLAQLLVGTLAGSWQFDSRPPGISCQTGEQLRQLREASSKTHVALRICQVAKVEHRDLPGNRVRPSPATATE